MAVGLLTVLASLLPLQRDQQKEQPTLLTSSQITKKLNDHHGIFSQLQMYHPHISTSRWLMR